MSGPDPLPTQTLRWICDPAKLEFSTTADIEPAAGIVGQSSAVEALRFGLEINAPGQNVFVRGLAGTGRLTLVQRLLSEIHPDVPPADDICYVFNFDQPDRPRAVRVPRGTAEQLQSKTEELCQFIADDLPSAMRDDLVQRRTAELERSAMKAIEGHTKPLESELAEAGLALLMAQNGKVTQPVVLPIIDGEPAPPERLATLRAEGKLDAETYAGLETKLESANERVEDVFKKVGKLQREARLAGRKLMAGEARSIISNAASDIREAFDVPAVHRFVDGIVQDVVERRLNMLASGETDFTQLYAVNVLVSHGPDEVAPVIIENAPSVRALVGSVDASVGPDGSRHADHMSIHAGSLLRADGGVLILEAQELLAHQGAWAALVRTLRSGRVELVPPDMFMPWGAPAIKPEPVEVNVKVVLLGEANIYYLLDERDPDFPNLFKVLADFDATLPRTDDTVGLYAGVIARIARDEGLVPFDAAGVAALAEHGARICASAGKLTARFGRLADIAREAAYLTRKSGSKTAGAADVVEAVRRTKARADGPPRRFRDSIARGSIRIETSGTAIGQVNGLAVIKAGPLTYGFPSRITASLGPGSGGAINIERESKLSGAIHTKAFYILGGLLRNLLRTPHPLTFEASIAFEQSYGGIDGDSASGAEICCLLSALTRLPVHQGLAMTGAIDQQGNILPIGAVNEKIEGFYDTVCARGAKSDGPVGVIIPQANVGDLMLRADVVAACAAGDFAVWSVERIEQAIALFFGVDAGVRSADGDYAAGTVLAAGVESAGSLYERSSPGAGRS